MQAVWVLQRGGLLSTVDGTGSGLTVLSSFGCGCCVGEGVGLPVIGLHHTWIQSTLTVSQVWPWNVCSLFRTPIWAVEC